MEEQQKKDSLARILEIRWLAQENASFRDEEGYLSMTLRLEEPDEEGLTERVYDRVLLNRCFPFDEPESHISVTDTEQQEIGMIRELDRLSEESQAACRAELARKYFTRRILSIEKIKERYGFTHWEVTTDSGKTAFTLQDTYRSITKVTPDHLLINDMDGNVYEILSVDGLSRRSYRHIELYL